MKKKTSEVFAWIIFIIFMIVVQFIFFRYIAPLIYKPEVVYRLENVTMVVYDEDTSETFTYYIENEPVYVEVEIN